MRGEHASVVRAERGTCGIAQFLRREIPPTDIGIRGRPSACEDLGDHSRELSRDATEGRAEQLERGPTLYEIHVPTSRPKSPSVSHRQQEQRRDEQKPEVARDDRALERTHGPSEASAVRSLAA